MISLHSVLASGNAIATMIEAIFVIFLVLAFSLGFAKGFRKVSWFALRIVVAWGVYFAMSSMIPINGTRPLINALFSLLIAVGCIVGTMLAFGALACKLRPKIRWVKDDVNGDTSLAEYGLEFEPEYLDYDGEDEARPYGMKIKNTGNGPPSAFGRILGGIACLMNVWVIFFVLAAPMVMLIDSNIINMSSMQEFVNGGTYKGMLMIVKTCAMDFLMIALMVLMAGKGYNSGLIDNLRALFVWALRLGGVALCCYFPFSSAATAETGALVALGNFVDKCTVMFEGTGGALSGIIGKLFASICLTSIWLLIVALLNYILRKLCDSVYANRGTRTLDGVVGAFVYTIIGAAIVLLMWFFIVAMSNFGIFNVENIVSETQAASCNLYQYAKAVLDGLLAPVLTK